MSLIIRILLGALLFAGEDSGDWEKLALRLNGASLDDQKIARVKLTQIPHLKDLLANELKGENRFLALDVISSLHIKTLLPNVIEGSVTDSTGFFYNAINALHDPSHAKMIGDLYIERLGLVNSVSISPTAQVIMLDTIGRLGRGLNEETLWSFIRSPSFEVRSAALYYIRSRTVKRKLEPLFPMIEELLRGKPYQLRIQSIFLLSELKRSYRDTVNTLLQKCLNDPQSEVRTLCDRVIKL